MTKRLPCKSDKKGVGYFYKLWNRDRLENYLIVPTRTNIDIKPEKGLLNQTKVPFVLSSM